MREQPDFHKLFHDYFGKAPGKVKYEVRPTTNQLHDLAFLWRLIVDAQFTRESVSLRNRRLTIPLKRICWELTEIPEARDMREGYQTRSLLTIYPVLNVVWAFRHEWSRGDPYEFHSKDHLLIWHFLLQYYSREDDDTMPLIIASPEWHCRITVFYPRLRIQLKDLEVPNVGPGKEVGKWPRPRAKGKR